MATSLDELPAADPASGRLNVVVDTPQGSRNKYKFDAQHGQWRLSKVLPLGLSFPCDFGFLPSTQGEDGDPWMLFFSWTSPRSRAAVPARLTGVLEAGQTENGNRSQPCPLS
jgi:inorganic pyrophosphatase